MKVARVVISLIGAAISALFGFLLVALTDAPPMERLGVTALITILGFILFWSLAKDWLKSANIAQDRVAAKRADSKVNRGFTMFSNRIKIVLIIVPIFLATAIAIFWDDIQKFRVERQNQKFTQDMKEFYDKPWHILMSSNRRGEDGKPMMYCQEPEESPAKVMQRFDREGVSYQVDETMDEFAKEITFVKIKVDDGAYHFFRGEQWCRFWASAKGIETFDPETYK